MRTLLIALGASVAMSGAALAMDGGCGSKAYTADAGKLSKPTTSETAAASTSQPAAPVEASKPADVAQKPVDPKKPS